MRTRIVIAAAILTALAACGPQQSVDAAKSPTTKPADHAGHDLSDPVTLSVAPSSVYRVGQPVTMTVRLKHSNGATVGANDLAVKHEHVLHVMTVDVGLQDYAHAHPTANADGSFSFIFTPRFDRPYRLWADFSLKNDGAHAEPKSVAQDGVQHGAGSAGHDQGHDARFASVDVPVGVGAAPPVTPAQSLTAEAEGMRFQLSMDSDLRVGQVTKARLSVQDAQGEPFAKLEPLMGAFAHMVGFDPGATTMMHLHPEGAEPKSASARGGPVLAFVVKPERAGPTRLFAQVRANGREVPVPFTVVVSP